MLTLEKTSRYKLAEALFPSSIVRSTMYFRTLQRFKSPHPTHLRHAATGVIITSLADSTLLLCKVSRPLTSSFSLRGCGAVWEYLGFGVGLLNFQDYKSTRIGYASSTTVDDLASSERCSHMITVSAPMQGNKVRAKTSPSVDASPAPHSPCSPLSVSSCLSTTVRDTPRFCANIVPFISLSRHRVVDRSPHPEKSDHRSASTCFGRLFDPRQYNTYACCLSVKPNVTHAAVKPSAFGSAAGGAR